jgi:hypothetical protein
VEYDVYAPPKSKLGDASTEVDANAAEFYIVAVPKLLTLFIFTVGIYGVYWFYKNWSRYKLNHKVSMWPVMRGLFSIFFAHSLFRRVNETLENKSMEHSWAPAGLATLYVVCSIASNISDRVAMRGVGSPLTDIVGFVLLAGVGLALYKAQIAINLACDDPEGESNSALTFANIVWILMGAALWSLAIVGMLATEGEV